MAITTSTPRRSAVCCGPSATPPNTATEPSPECFPYFSKLSATCMQSSRVGVRMRTRVRRSPPNRRWMRGRVNAAVFPVPVCASPMTSRPLRINGMASAWIGVGVSYPASRTASSNSGARPSASNAVGASIVVVIAWYMRAGSACPDRGSPSCELVATGTGAVVAHGDTLMPLHHTAQIGSGTQTEGGPSRVGSDAQRGRRVRHCTTASVSQE